MRNLWQYVELDPATMEPVGAVSPDLPALLADRYAAAMPVFRFLATRPFGAGGAPTAGRAAVAPRGRRSRGSGG